MTAKPIPAPRHTGRRGRGPYRHGRAGLRNVRGDRPGLHMVVPVTYERRSNDMKCLTICSTLAAALVLSGEVFAGHAGRSHSPQRPPGHHLAPHRPAPPHRPTSPHHPAPHRPASPHRPTPPQIQPVMPRVPRPAAPRPVLPSVLPKGPRVQHTSPKQPAPTPIRMKDLLPDPAPRALPLSPPRGEPLSTFHPVVVGEPGGAVKETGFRVEHRDGSRLGASLTHGPDGVGASAEVVRKGTTVTGSIQQTPAGQVVSVGGQVDRRDGTRVGATVTHGPDGVGASAEVVRKGTTVTGSIQQTPAGQVVSVGGQVDRRDGTRVGATVTHGPDGVGASAEVGLHSGTKVRAGVDPGPQGPKVDAELVIPFP